MTFDEKIGRRLRHYRQLKGFTQQELAKRLGISFQQVQKYESGSNKISLERLCELCSVLSLPLTAWLADIHPLPESLNAEMEDRQSLALLQAFRHIPTPRHRTLITELAWALGEE